MYGSGLVLIFIGKVIIIVMQLRQFGRHYRYDVVKDLDARSECRRELSRLSF